MICWLPKTLSLSHSLELGFLFAIAMMFVIWLIAVGIKNAGIVDIAWSLGFLPMALIATIFGSGDNTRKLLIGVMACLWSLRLGVYLWLRVMKHHPEEDGRYKTLREQFPRHTNLMFLGFFELQAVLLVVLSVPFFLISQNQAPTLHPLEWIGFAIWIVAICGEAIADYQLHQFRMRPESRGHTCQIGLWHYSRHPNYFFEWLIWVAYFLFALASPWGWITLYCPLLMLYFLLRVTGIPATEAHAVKSRGEEYRKYQRTTSGFIPWFPKKS
ncbi:MAG: DUF1295 domain-containing protein [Chthoniobacterales bacterium]